MNAKGDAQGKIIDKGIPGLQGVIWQYASFLSRQQGLDWLSSSTSRNSGLVWFVLQGKLNTRERISRLNILNPVETICLMCQQEVETIDLLFCHCSFSWCFWTDCLSWWEITWCCPNSVMELFEAWIRVPHYGLDMKLWKSLFCAVIWSLWNKRNRLVFEHMRPNFEMERRQVKLTMGILDQKLA